jgi:hypothetical protein
MLPVRGCREIGGKSAGKWMWSRYEEDADPRNWVIEG